MTHRIRFMGNTPSRMWSPTATYGTALTYDLHSDQCSHYSSNNSNPSPSLICWSPQGHREDYTFRLALVSFHTFYSHPSLASCISIIICTDMLESAEEGRGRTVLSDPHASFHCVCSHPSLVHQTVRSDTHASSLLSPKPRKSHHARAVVLTRGGRGQTVLSRTLTTSLLETLLWPRQT